MPAAILSPAHCLRILTPAVPPLYFSRRRKGSGDLPGLQSRRFGPSRVEWWIRLPHASAVKSLNPFADRLLFGTSWDKNRRYFFHGLPLLVANDMPINAKGYARIGMTQLCLGHGCGCSRRQQHAGMQMPEGVEASLAWDYRDAERTQDWHELLAHDIFGNEETAAIVEEKEPWPYRGDVLVHDRCQGVREGKGRFAAGALRGL